MRFATDGSYTWSASDLYAASACEFGFLRNVDVKQGRIPDPGFTWDPMRERAGKLGDIHEQRILAEYRARFGAGVVEIPSPRSGGVTLPDAVAATVAALQGGADVVFQAAFLSADGPRSFVGYADFVVRQPDGRYRIEDSKLARTAKGMALLQMSAYAGELRRLGFEPDDTITVVLGDGTRSDHELAAFEPLLGLRRDRLFQIVDERTAEGAATNDPVQWGDERYAICGSCDWCAAEVAATNDVLGVASLTRVQRTKLRALGIETIQGLAESEGPVQGIGNATLDKLRAQSALQLEAVPGQPPPFRVINADALAAIPHSSPGDIFFDFEGDPLYSEGAGEQTTWGLDYLWGWVDAEGEFQCLWAHDFAQERNALVAFLEMVSQRRAIHPDMHIYHYASYERTHLLSMAARWGVGEEAVDALLREHVLVDLYPVVKKALLVGSASYSIKKLEPLYMGDEHREGVDNAGDSMVEYANACDQRDAGDVAGYQAKLADIEQYNAYDCLSTLRLRDWLAALADEAGVEPVVPEPELDEPEPEPPAGGADGLDRELTARELAEEMLKHAGDPLVVPRTPGQTAAAMGSAALGYFWRESKSFWHDYFARLIDPVDEWADTRDVIVADTVEVLRDWHLLTPRHRIKRRLLRLTGTIAPGSRFTRSETDGPVLLYEYPGPVRDPRAEPLARSAVKVRVHDSGPDWVEVLEPGKGHDEGYEVPPIALTPQEPPMSIWVQGRIKRWASNALAFLPEWGPSPFNDLLLRRPTRLASGGSLPRLSSDVESVTAAVLDLDNSYLAVQGPPGTGKTYLGASVIADLVMNHGWRVSVTAQSHAVIENLLRAVGRHGVPMDRIGKSPQHKISPYGPESGITNLNKEDRGAWMRSGGGRVIGSTMWDFASPKTGVPAGDLLVVDEAGQYSLPYALVASLGTSRMLLLGDPQQLAQVTQGAHPEPIDTSTLGWLMEGHDVLPEEFGYFLGESYRMHPAVTEPVSRLSYQGRLHAHPSTSERMLERVAPGLVAVPVVHRGNAIASVEEATEVARIVGSLIGTRWTDPAHDRDADPLGEDDFIVITPYNAQRNATQDALAAAGWPNVRVGTVDKFQGQEAAVAIVSLAASSAVDVPRGLEFLINRNRLNVAISRAKWTAYLLYSPGLLDHLPGNVTRLAELGRFARLAQARRLSRSTSIGASAATS